MYQCYWALVVWGSVMSCDMVRFFLALSYLDLLYVLLYCTCI